MIGKGSFGKVHLGIHILSKKKVAIKCIDKTYIKEEKAQKKIVQEVKILRSLIHRNIIKILEVFENKKFVFIVTDYASRGDLLKYMKEHGVFKEHRAKPIVAQILKSLEYCHSKGILHRDIKLDNILLDKDMQVKLCDFGVSRYMSDEKIKERCGTPAYIAPEIINGGGYSKFQADVRNGPYPRFGAWEYSCTPSLPARFRSKPRTSLICTNLSSKVTSIFLKVWNCPNLSRL